MARAILNYSTKVPAERTVAEVVTMLREHGARRIMVEYEEKMESGIAFSIETEFGDRTFRLPCKVEAMRKRLQYYRSRSIIRSDRFTTMEHAAAVAWRVIKDWLEAQLSLIEVGMADITEVMLPYMAIDSNGGTVYTLMRESGLGMLPAHAGSTAQ